MQETNTVKHSIAHLLSFMTYELKPLEGTYMPFDF